MVLVMIQNSLLSRSIKRTNSDMSSYSTFVNNNYLNNRSHDECLSYEPSTIEHQAQNVYSCKRTVAEGYSRLWL